MQEIDLSEEILRESAERIVYRWAYGNRYRDLTTEELWLMLSQGVKRKYLYSNNWRRKHKIPMMRRKK